MKYLRVKYVQEVVDRYGRKHLYFRRPGYRRCRLDGLPGSQEFAQSYQAALDGVSITSRPGRGRVIKGTFADLFAQYYGSLDFKSLQPATQKNYRRVLSKLDSFSDLPVRSLDRQMVLRLRDKGDSIGLMKRLKTLMNFAIDYNFRDDNPADKVKIKGARRPFRAWNEGDIKKFLAFYPADSRQNLAIMLLLYTGARRSDVVTFGWHNISGEVLTFTPRKTSFRPGEDGPKVLHLPIHAALQQRIQDLPKDDAAFLMTEYGEPMSEFGFSNWFSESARAAGLPHNSSPHGLRKAASRRLAEAGASTHEIASVTGHSSLKEVERYTKSVQQAKLARSAFRLLPKNKP